MKIFLFRSILIFVPNNNCPLETNEKTKR